MKPLHRLTPFAVFVSLLLPLAGCGQKEAAAPPGAGGMPPPEVAVVTVAAERLALIDELPGRVEATRQAQVRARIPGIVMKRVFREGSEVKAGDVLFRIDPAPLQATLNSAEAALARAQASLAQAELKARRYKPLVETNAISKQEYDAGVAAQKLAAADVAAARAARETARLNLGYATVNAPISGRIGRALVTEGALVGQGEATPLALIQQLDPIYVNITQSANDALALQRAMAAGKLQQVGKGEAKVAVLTQDGALYPHPGRLLFHDLTVDPGTGAMTLRAEVPNPDRFLLPGMYVRARVEQAVNEQAITVPQQAVQRGVEGTSVLVVGTDGKVAPRQIQVSGAQGNAWIVTDGLKTGEQVVVEGFQKVQPGATVKTVPWKHGGAPAQAGPATAPANSAAGNETSAASPDARPAAR